MTRLDRADREQATIGWTVLGAIFLIAFACGRCDPSAPRQGGVEQRRNDLRARPASSASSVQASVPLSARALAPAQQSQRSLGARIVATGLPRAYAASAMVSIVHGCSVCAALVDGDHGELRRLVLGRIGARDVRGHVRQFDGARNRLRVAEVSEEQVEDRESCHGRA